MFILPDGRVILQGADGRQVRSRRHSTLLKILIEHADGCWPLEELATMVAGSAGIPAQAVEDLAETLVARGILIPETEGRPEWMSERQWTVQQSMLEWLAPHERPFEDRLRFQYRLSQAVVVVVGVGGTGSMTARLLSASGVRMLRLVDGDVVEPSNLGRQFLYRDADIGKPKAVALADYLRAFDPELHVETVTRAITDVSSAREALEGASIAIVTADEPPLLLQRWIDEAAKSLYVPYLRTQYDWFGPLFVPGLSPCFACLEAHWRQSDDGLYDRLADAVRHRIGRLPASPAGIAHAAATYCDEAIAWLTRIAAPLSLGAQVRCNLEGVVRRAIHPSPDCPVCRTIKLP